jgi:hypothetical protein
MKMNEEDLKEAKSEYEPNRVFVMYEAQYALYHDGKRVGIDEDFKQRLQGLGLRYLRDVRYSSRPCSVFEYDNGIEKLEDRILRTEGVLDIIYDSPVEGFCDHRSHG